MISTDEELQQDVQRAGENAVRNGHGDPQQPTFKHIHGGLLFALKKSQTGYKVLLVPGVPLKQPGVGRFSLGDQGQSLGFTHSGDALLQDGETGGKEGREAVKSQRLYRH